MFRRLILISLAVLLTVPVFARGAEYRKKYYDELYAKDLKDQAEDEDEDEAKDE